VGRLGTNLAIDEKVGRGTRNASVRTGSTDIHPFVFAQLERLRDEIDANGSEERAIIRRQSDADTTVGDDCAGCGADLDI